MSFEETETCSLARRMSEDAMDSTLLTRKMSIDGAPLARMMSMDETPLARMMSVDEMQATEDGIDHF